MAQSHPRTLSFRLLGKPGWRCHDAEGELRLKFAALVAHVAINGRQASDALAKVLWPGDAAKARSSLRTYVLRLRQATGHAVFLQGDAIEFAPGVDCDLFRTPAEWPTPELMAERELLAGIDFTSPSLLAGWLAQQRERWRALIGEALVARAAALETGRSMAPALALLERATLLAPWLESAWRRRMELHYLAGDQAAAAKDYAQLQQHLRGVLPSAETSALWRTIERAGRTPAARAPRLPASLLRPPVLVGRERQWAAMEHAWSAARPFMLEGEAGIGKSRLLAEFLREHGPAVVVEGRAGDERAPYATLASLLRALIDQQALVPEAFVARELARVLPELGAPADRGQADQTTLWRAVERLLELAAESGVRALAVDDLHFTDLASIEVLRWLSAGSARNLLRFGFATRRQEPGPRRDLVADWLTDSQRPALVPVAPLSAHDVAELVATLDLGRAPASAEQLHAHTGGQPFLLLETLKELALHAEAPATLPLPANALPLLERRLQALPGRTQPLLRLAALAGDALEPERAASALQMPLDDTMARFDELESQGVLRGRRFVHELMREAALATLAPAERRHWHGVAALALAGGTRVPKARLAAHWEAAERWPEAAAAFRAAGIDARDAGRLHEAHELLERSASCARAAGDAEAEFEAVHDGFIAERDRLGPAELQALVARLGALARTPEQQARVAVAEAGLAVTRFARDAGVLELARRALELAAPHGLLRIDALSTWALALAQSGRFDEAIASAREASALASAAGEHRKAREADANLSYAYYEAGRLGDAIETTRLAAAAFDAAGDRATTGQLHSNLATLVLLSGDPAAALGPALRAREFHREIGSSARSPLAVVNLASLASAYAFLGRFGEAIEIAHEIANAIDHGVAAALRAKAQLAAAHLWLLLGADQSALAALGPDGEGWPFTMQVQRCWALARVARIQGADDAPLLRRIGEVVAAHQDAPLMLLPWLEWSRQGDAREVEAQMARVQAAYARAGMPGTARSAALRRIARLAEIDEPQLVETAATLARELQPLMGRGLHHSTYLPEAWATLAAAFGRAGDEAARGACLTEARRWIAEVALPQVPAAWRDSFLTCNPANRALPAA